MRQGIHRLIARLERRRMLSRSRHQRYSIDALQEAALSRNEMYGYCLYFFDKYLPAKLREHRHYFSQHGRGFGEDAFHAMWYLLFEKFRPAHALEIGVYRGQTVSLWKLLSEILGCNCEVACISPFSSSGDSVSNYLRDVDYYEDLLANFKHFGLKVPVICRHFSTDPAAKAFIADRSWDLIYIDGNHDYDVARKDWEACSRSVRIGGMIVLDDAALMTDYRPASFSTAGHPGPSRVAREIDSSRFQEIFAVGHNRVFQRIG